MKFIREFELMLYVPEIWTPTEEMIRRWCENSKNASPYMFRRLLARIKDSGAFNNDMVIPSNKAFRALLNPSFVSKSGRTAQDIINAQSKNMSDKFKRWVRNLERAYAEVDGVSAKAYKDKIDAAVGSWAKAVATKSIRLTGDKIRGRSVAPIVAYYLAGDPRATSWVRQGDTADGAPYNIAGAHERPALKAALQQRLTQGGMMVINSEYHPSIIDEQNKINAKLLTKLRDPDRCDAFADSPTTDKCFCAWAMDGNKLYLHLQVGLTG